MSFNDRFYGFRALSIIGKCTSRHLFAYGGLQPICCSFVYLQIALQASLQVEIVFVPLRMLTRLGGQFACAQLKITNRLQKVCSSNVHPL